MNCQYWGIENRLQHARRAGHAVGEMFGISAPRGTPAAIIATLSKAVQPALSAPELQQRMQDQGVALRYTPPSEFAPVLEQEFRVWGKAVEMAKVKFD